MSVMMIGAKASERIGFVGVEAVESSDIMYGKAEMGQLDEVLYESVTSHLMDFAEYLAEQGGGQVTLAKINQWLLMNKKYFTNQSLLSLENTLKNLDEENFRTLTYMNYKDPTVSLVLSIFLGGLGVDRFVIGDIGLGVGKLLTGGGLGVWWLVDLFCIQKATKNKNLEELNAFLSTVR